MQRCTFSVAITQWQRGRMLYERWEWCPDCKTVTQGFPCSTSDIQNTASILLACWTCTWDKLPYQNLKPRRTAICLTILIYYTLPFAVIAKVTSTIWTQVWSFICLLGASLIIWLLLWLLLSFILLSDTGGSEPSDGCLEAVSWLLCTESSASHAWISSYFWNCEEELQEGHGVTTHLLTVLCIGPSSNIPSDTANIFSNQECPIDITVTIEAAAQCTDNCKHTGNTVWMLNQALSRRLYKRFTALDFATALQSVYTFCETDPKQKRHLGSNKLAILVHILTHPAICKKEPCLQSEQRDSKILVG
jgi:hypothetical protein